MGDVLRGLVCVCGIALWAAITALIFAVALSSAGLSAIAFGILGLFYLASLVGLLGLVGERVRDL